MALLKQIKKDNGVTLNYHRVAKIDVETNMQVAIVVESYIDVDGRNYEKRYANGEIIGNPTFPYTQSQYLHTKYDEASILFKGNIVQNAYEWLKTLPEYKGASDI